MLINYVPGEECRIALVENGRLEELYQERASSELHVGNIYKGRVSNVEPSIQAAFIDFGLERNGFLHVSDLHPMYFPGKLREEFESVGNKTPRRERPPIQKCLKRGDEVLVQVIREGIGTKGPTLTSYLSIPGRFIVMMPQMQRLGVSRKIEDEDLRRSMRQTLDELNPPKGFGFILRTAGIDRTKSELKRDLAYLQRLWKAIEARRETVVVGELYEESDLIIRTIRDVSDAGIERIIVDHPEGARRARDFLAVASPRAASNVVIYNDSIPLFHRYDIEPQIENVNTRTLLTPSGIHLVFDSTEALVAIDVNSGKNRQAKDSETNAYKVNLEAADEIARQLRLRDLGGVVVIDFIDMIAAKHRRAVEQQFRKNMKKDRARTRIGAISQFGMMEMTRQRMRPPVDKSLHQDCPHCQGAGQVKRAESVLLDVMRRLALIMNRKNVAVVTLTVSPTVAFQLLNNKRRQLVDFETHYGKSILVRVNDGGSLDYLELTAQDQRGNLVDVVAQGPFTEPTLEAVEAINELESDRPELDVADRAEAYQQSSDLMDEPDDHEQDQPAQSEEAETASMDQPVKKGRRRRRGGKRRSRKKTDDATQQTTTTSTNAEPDKEQPQTAVASNADDADAATDQPAKKSRRRRRGGRKHKKNRSHDSGETPSPPPIPTDNSTKPLTSRGYTNQSAETASPQQS